MDTELVVRAQAGDEGAFERLAIASAERLHAVAYRILRDPDAAEDATQQALLTMWQKLPALRDPSRFEGWAYRTLVRICYALSAESRRARLRIVPIVDREPAVHEDLSGVEEQQTFERVFGRLSLEQRAVVVLHYYLGLTLDEVADALDVSPGTARSRLSRALKRMREILGPELGRAMPESSEVA